MITGLAMLSSAAVAPSIHPHGPPNLNPPPLTEW